jgi:hypothetical protein
MLNLLINPKKTGTLTRAEDYLFLADLSKQHDLNPKNKLCNSGLLHLFSRCNGRMGYSSRRIGCHMLLLRRDEIEWNSGKVALFMIQPINSDLRPKKSGYRSVVILGAALVTLIALTAGALVYFFPLKRTQVYIIGGLLMPLL